MKTFATTLLALAICCVASAATSVTQYGITWTFSADKTVGQYANGDYYVVGPVTITSITPASTLVSGRTINGAMVNPQAGTFVPNGFDSGLLNYQAAYNAARPGGNDLSAGNPLVVGNGSSVVSVISHATAGNRPQFTDGAILTVVASAPAAGSFRPSPSNPDKTPPANISSLNYSILRNLATVSGAPALATMEDAFARPWFEIELSNQGREWHPLNNQPMYGRDMGALIGDALLTLHINRTNSEKQTLYMRVVQYGLDVYGAAKHAGDTDTYPGWWANGGFNCGRKAPMLLAGMALNNSAIIAEANHAAYPIFQDDQQIFYVGGGDVGKAVTDNYIIGSVPDRMRLTYTSGFVGLPEWGIEHQTTGALDGSNLNTIYRDVNAPVILPHALFALLVSGAKANWNNNAYFDYADRLAHIGMTNASTFAQAMYAAYRSLGPTAWTAPAPVFAPGYIPVEGTLLILSLSDAVQVGAGGAPSLSITASGGAVTATYAPTATTASLISNGYGTLSSNVKYLLSRAIGEGETCTFSIANGVNQIESLSSGLDAVSATALLVVNYSTATSSGASANRVRSLHTPRTIEVTH